MSESSITTILFTDLVNSTALMQRVGDESAQRIFQTHHQLLSDAVAQTGGEALQWLGDGLMAAFGSTADAVRCAIAMQQAAQGTASDRLQIRVGLNVGEILRQQTGSGYFGTPVVVSRRLCDRAQGGQILCSSTVAGLLAGRQAFHFQSLGDWELKGIADRVGVCAVVYDADQPTAGLAKTPFVGRHGEIERLQRALAAARRGSGRLVLLAGEPGIGKTRMAEEFAEGARRENLRVFWGRCFEGDAAAPYGPFAEALARHAKDADPAELRTDLGPYGAALAKLVPALAERVPDLPPLLDLQPDEERWRLFEAVVQLLANGAARAPLILVLDDLHWADGGSVALLRHIARFLSDIPISCWQSTATSSSTAPIHSANP